MFKAHTLLDHISLGLVAIKQKKMEGNKEEEGGEKENKEEA